MKKTAKTLMVGVSQMELIAGDKEANLLTIERHIREAHKQGVELLVLPELVLTSFINKDALRPLSEPRLGESLLRLVNYLKSYPMAVVYSFPEYVCDDEIYNTTCIINERGVIGDFYRKIHLFSPERRMVRSGRDWVTANVKGVSVGLLVCFDLDFPEASRTLAEMGAELIVAPSNNMVGYSLQPRIYSISRALENQVFVAYSNRVGTSNDYVYVGESIIVDPMGEIIADMRGDSEGIAVATLDFSKIDQAKEVYSYLNERKKHLYW